MRQIKADPPPTPVRRKIVDGGFLILIAFTVISGGAVWWLRGGGQVAEILSETFGFVLVLGPKIAAGMFIAATLPLVLPRDRVARWIGADSGWRGLGLAAVAGAIIPGGPMMTFGLAAGFAAAGADIGALIACVTGWSLLSLNRTLIWELSFLPVDMVALRVLLCLPFPILLGWAARLAQRKVAA